MNQNRQLFTDEEIIKGFLAGNDEHIRIVTFWIRKTVGRKLWKQKLFAEDVVATSLMKAIENLQNEKFAFNSSLKTYIERITRYTIIDITRSRRIAELYLQDAHVDPPSDSTPLDIFESKEELYIYTLIWTLIGEHCRQLWNMVFTHSLRYKEIAEQLGLSVGAVKTRISRAKNRQFELNNDYRETFRYVVRLIYQEIMISLKWMPDR